MLNLLRKTFFRQTWRDSVCDYRGCSTVMQCFPLKSWHSPIRCNANSVGPYSVGPYMFITLSLRYVTLKWPPHSVNLKYVVQYLTAMSEYNPVRSCCMIRVEKTWNNLKIQHFVLPHLQSKRVIFDVTNKSTNPFSLMKTHPVLVNVTYQSHYWPCTGVVVPRFLWRSPWTMPRALSLVACWSCHGIGSRSTFAHGCTQSTLKTRGNLSFYIYLYYNFP